jgi:hypothetical protein
MRFTMRSLTMAAAFMNCSQPGRFKRVLGLLGIVLAFLLAGCAASDEILYSGETDLTSFDVDPDGSAEDLYFEALRLHSAGLLGSKRLDELQRHLAVVDDVYSRDADYGVVLRDTVLSHLRLASREMRREEALALKGLEGRAYARQLNRAGVKAARQHAAGMVLIAGMVGVPTSAEEGLLMVAIPAGGYLLVKAGGMALKRVAFVLRNCRNADDVVRSAPGLGFKIETVADASALRTAVARTDKGLAEQFEEVLPRIPRTDANAPRDSGALHLTSVREVEVRSQAPRASEIRSVVRGAQSYASADVLRSRVRDFIAEQLKPEFDDPIEFFIHGTTHARAVELKPKAGLRLFTTTDIHVALLFSMRTVGREGGRVGGAVIALPRTVVDHLRKSGLLRTQPVPDMPRLLETIFEPGAVEALEMHAAIRPLPEGFFDP